MHELIEQFAARLPLDFRILYRQFLLRVIDLETLSIQADVTEFLGQFAGILIMLSLVHATFNYVGYTVFTDAVARLAFCQHMAHYEIATTMLVIGLVTVISWDSTFPDRRDVMVLSPLPLTPRTILLAKLCASAAVLGLAALALNIASGLMMALLMGAQEGPAWGFLQSLPAWGFTLAAASIFLYGSVLIMQGLTALVLPRRLFLRVSAFLQLAAFGLFLGVYFVQPSLPDAAAMAAPENHWILACSPSYWFYALFNQLNGSLPRGSAWIAYRAWIGLIVAVSGAAGSLLLCYIHTMKKTIEQPDLVPGAGGFHWTPRVGNQLQTAVTHFSIRALTRSRQHRVAFAFYLAIVLGLALSLLRSELARPPEMSLDFVIATLLMILFAVAGLRNVFSLPISLTANWVLRTTQLRPSPDYVAATRRALLVIAASPAWMLAASLSLHVRPAGQAAIHLVVLAVAGCIVTESCLIGFYKVPFTCSYLPGKANIQVAFWGFLIVLLVVIVPCAEFELRALQSPLKSGWMIATLAAALAALFAFNQCNAKDAVIYFEETPEEVITTLGLSV
jgi:hypothetical protein